MLILALANLTHRKVRSALSVLAVAIAIMLLLVLVGLSNGTLDEISQRMQSVQAEIVVRDQHFDLASMSGGKLWEKEIPRLEQLQIQGQPAVQTVIPVFLARMKLAGLSQNVFGIHPGHFPTFAGQRRLLDGTFFSDLDSPRDAADYSPAQLLDQAADQSADQSSPQAEPPLDLPLIIDQRLANAAQLRVGDRTSYGNSDAHIVGIIETGVAGRVFAPINRLRAGSGIIAPTAHMFFVKAHPALSNDQLGQLCQTIEATTHRSATLVANYHQELADKFRGLTIFMTLVSVIALAICFLFILVTMYTMVLERQKEIAILQSLGAGPANILAQTLQEATLICTLGAALGLALSFAARYLIQTFQPLMTVELRPAWIIGAVLIAVVGGAVSALYPGYLALRHDPVETLNFE